jgi:alpha-glucosidase (family GH31 glycosyl hydrolase)
MHDYKDFTVDPVNFAGLGAFVAKIQKDYNMKYIPIIDAGVAQRLPSIDEYAAYDAGVKADVFIKAGSDNTTIFTGQVWAVDAAFPDWFAKEAGSYWGEMMTAFHDMVGFNGVWLDMNEASNMLCEGTCYDDQKAAKPVQNELPYIPSGRDLGGKSISLDAVHADGTLELDAHSLYGTMEVHNTHNWFKDTQKERTMIISRSSYAGMGKYGSRWLGDNFSSDAYMAYSVTGVMGNNIAGITLAGSDICGFIGDTNADLCARWYTLGAYYPFSRNHNAWNNAPQEPWEFAKDVVPGSSSTYLDVIQSAMYRKLHMIRYLYTQMSIIQQEGGSYFRPLFYDFPNEEGAYEDQELNIMLGPSLKLGILSGTSANTTDFYFPAGTWCEIYCRSGEDGDCCIIAPTGGLKKSLQT